MKTQKHVRGGGGRTMPTPLPSASSGGATARPSDSPHGATALIAKTPFFFKDGCLSGQFQPCHFFGRFNL